MLFECETSGSRFCHIPNVTQRKIFLTLNYFSQRHFKLFGFPTVFSGIRLKLILRIYFWEYSFTMSKKAPETNSMFNKQDVTVYLT